MKICREANKEQEFMPLRKIPLGTVVQELGADSTGGPYLMATRHGPGPASTRVANLETGIVTSPSHATTFKVVENVCLKVGADKE